MCSVPFDCSWFPASLSLWTWPCLRGRQRVQVEFLHVLLWLCCPWRPQPEVPCFGKGEHLRSERACCRLVGATWHEASVAREVRLRGRCEVLELNEKVATLHFLAPTEAHRFCSGTSIFYRSQARDRLLVKGKWHGCSIAENSVVHKLMDAMSSALKLRGAGLEVRRQCGADPAGGKLWVVWARAPTPFLPCHFCRSRCKSGRRQRPLHASRLHGQVRESILFCKRACCLSGHWSCTKLHEPDQSVAASRHRARPQMDESIFLEIREHQIWGEGHVDFLGESEGSLPLPKDSLLDAGEAINDFWSMSGNFIHRHHVEPRVKLYSSREESFPFPL